MIPIKVSEDEAFKDALGRVQQAMDEVSAPSRHIFQLNRPAVASYQGNLIRNAQDILLQRHEGKKNIGKERQTDSRLRRVNSFEKHLD